MSGIAGILNLDGAPADGALLGRMTAAIAHRGPDGIRHVVYGPVALGHCMLATTPESLHETQPLWDASGRYCLVVDGRVDNREELKGGLAAKGLGLRDDTDAELVLQAYVAWGEECAVRIIGDFALVVYDRLERRLLCARDVVGVKPFYYWTDGKTFLCASELQQLFQHDAVPKEPNEGMVAEYLADRITSLSETLWKDVFRLPRAHHLVVHKDGSTTQRRYWYPDPTAEFAPREERQFVEAFESVFREAVRCRLRANGVAAVELSGGLDSSSVLGMAVTLEQAGSTSLVQAVSAVYPGLPCDETPYIAEVEQRWRLKSIVAASTQRPRDFFDAAARFCDYPGGPDYDREVARATGARVLLSGLGADEWLDRRPVPPSFARGRRALIDLRSPAGVRRLAAGVLRRVSRRSHVDPTWIPRSFARRTRLDERSSRTPPVGRFRSAGQRQAFELLTWGHHAMGLETLERRCSFLGLEARHPFHDRRLIEYALALPDEQLWSDGRTKWILRRVDDLLPERIRGRRDKAEFSHDYARVLCTSDAGECFSASKLGTNGWVDAAVLTTMYREFCQAFASGQVFLPHLWPLWLVFGSEAWLRECVGNSGGVYAHGANG